MTKLQKKQAVGKSIPGTARRPGLPKKKPGLEKRMNIKLELAYILLILLTTLFVFYPSLRNGFVETWDDSDFVINNPVIQQLNWNTIQKIFTTPANGNYGPLILLSWALEIRLWGMEPFHFHLFNLILHLACTLLAYFILLKLRLRPLFAVFGALLFGIHPMRVESVAWITERKDLLFGFFFLAGTYVYLLYLDAKTRRLWLYLFTFALFTLSVFSKIQAVSFPVCLLLLDYFSDRKDWKKALLEKIPFFLLSLGVGIAGVLVLQNAGMLAVNEQYSWFERSFFGLFSLVNYLYKLILPYPQSALYPYPMHHGENLPLIYLLSPFLLLALTFLIIRSKKWGKEIVFGCLFFLVNVFFVLQILAAGTQGGFLAERYTYIPYLGLFFALSAMFFHIIQLYPSAKRIIYGIMAAMLIVFVPWTRSRCGVWNNDESLWTDVLEKYSQLPNAWANRATYYSNNGKFDKALSDFDKALSIDSLNSVSLINRGKMYFEQGQADLALSDYLKLVRTGNKDVRVYSNLGAIYGERNDISRSLSFLKKALEIEPGLPNIYLNRAITYDKAGKTDSAIIDLKHYLTYDTTDVRVYSALSIYYRRLNNLNESLAWLNKAVDLKQDDGNLYLSRSRLLLLMGEKEKAYNDALTARNRGVVVDENYLNSIRSN